MGSSHHAAIPKSARPQRVRQCVCSSCKVGSRIYTVVFALMVCSENDDDSDKASKSSPISTRTASSQQSPLKRNSQTRKRGNMATTPTGKLELSTPTGLLIDSGKKKTTSGMGISLAYRQIQAPEASRADNGNHSFIRKRPSRSQRKGPTAK